MITSYDPPLDVVEEQIRKEKEKWFKYGMTGVKEYTEKEPVHCVRYGNQWCIEAINEGGHNCTLVNVKQVVNWVKANRPDLLK